MAAMLRIAWHARKSITAMPAITACNTYAQTSGQAMTRIVRIDFYD
jgi:hypothetical protein